MKAMNAIERNGVCLGISSREIEAQGNLKQRLPAIVRLGRSSGLGPCLSLSTKMAVCAVVCCALTLPAASAQELLFEVPGGTQNPWEKTGQFLLPIGDWDEDGWMDLLMSSGDGSAKTHVTAFSTKSGKKIYTADLQFEFFYGYKELITMPDINGDGFLELLQISYNAGFLGTGAVAMRSGLDSQILWTKNGDDPGSQFGHSATVIGDVDGDSFADIAVGAPGTDPLPSSTTQVSVGAVQVLSSKTGVELYRVYGPSFGGPEVGGGLQMGATCGAVGDQDGDGLVDFMVGPRLSSAGQINGVPIPPPIRILSGADGSLLKDLYEPEPGSPIQVCAASIGDIDGDGLDEFAIGYPQTALSPGGIGAAVLYRGGSFEPLMTWPGTILNEPFGSVIARLPDRDGDGFDDVVVGSNLWFDGSPLVPAGYGSVRGFSSKTYELLFEIRPEVPPNIVPKDFGFGLACLGDLNGDGVEEIAIGATEYHSALSPANFPGRVYVYSTVDLAFSGKPAWVSATAGGQQALELDFGAAHGGQLYFVAGSAAGIAPALELDGLALPLVPDGYTTLLLKTGGAPFLPNMLIGILDSAGQATLSTVVPSGASTLTGLTIWHAALVLGPLGNVVATSNSVALSFAP